MSKNESKGKRKQIKGKIHEGLGRLTDDETQQAKGEAEQTIGKVQEEFGKATKKRTHTHYHSHDLSDHDHV
jgi:uncharacterized protein YjbJ (UPF0337 family)